MEPSDLLKNAFDPSLFREQGHLLVDQLSEYLKHPERGKVFPYEAPSQKLHRWQDSASKDEIFTRYIEESMHLHHPHFMGHQ